MNIYLMDRTDDVDWDEYAGHVVAADTEEEARTMFTGGDWKVEQSKIEVTLIGVAPEGVRRGIILSDYHAG